MNVCRLPVWDYVQCNHDADGMMPREVGCGIQSLMGWTRGRSCGCCRGPQKEPKKNQDATSPSAQPSANTSGQAAAERASRREVHV
ncbi:hypothetical protein GGTG_09313 [Gaeumannomyces tritici R3-111a-1]|uniref:Uncharacterized protein n=1 Tax=Gaeumannomyces tritici (strain R3-111a-1) TaxID=644352 RepID=J3P716_GAET3|nr:hypothetical protein GGTG_09313 [Gaeumannomyces tritici R3-111a-1]EJT72447.1 hypothetical protein GGTG_09313 [Gaeumannomyces tritici R3-111a-1]